MLLVRLLLVILLQLMLMLLLRLLLLIGWMLQRLHSSFGPTAIISGDA